MKAVVITRPGGPEVLEIRDLGVPDCGAGEVRVRVRAGALNRADLLQRRGFYPAPAGAPADVPGLEIAGEVEECGSDVRGLRPGDRVMAVLGGGGQAERVCVAAPMCMRVPQRLDWIRAAAIPEAFLTSWDALFRLGGLRPGHSLLLHAAGSGVGTAAAQLARTAGGRVIALSRTPAKRERLTRLGCEHVLDPAAPELSASILEIAGGGGVDLALDLVGAAAVETHLACLRERGRWVLAGLLGGARAELDLGRVLRKRLTLAGTALRARSLEEKIELTREFERDGLPLLEAGRVEPIVDRCFPLEQVSEAHRYMESNANFGKIVLTIGDG